MAPNPSCEIKDGAAAYVTAVGGVNVTPTNTIIIRLASQVGVDSWQITCATTDETSDATAVTAALTIDPLTKTATFTAPAAGKAYRFRSVVNNGIDANGVVQTSYSTTFCVYTAVSGRRVLAADETTEGSTDFGWIVYHNDMIRNFGSGGGGGGSAGFFGANFHFLTYQNGSGVGATGLNHVPTTGVVQVNRGLVVQGTAVATLANAMLINGTAATGFQMVRPVLHGPIFGGTTVFTGTDIVADGLADHKPFSVVRTTTTTDSTPVTVFAFKPRDEALTSVFVEANAVASGGAAGGAYARATAIKMDGGVGTCSDVELTRNQEFTNAGFTGLSIGTGIWIGVSGATGFVNVKGTPTGRIKFGVTVTLAETSWA